MDFGSQGTSPSYNKQLARGQPKASVHGSAGRSCIVTEGSARGLVSPTGAGNSRGGLRIAWPIWRLYRCLMFRGPTANLLIRSATAARDWLGLIELLQGRLGCLSSGSNRREHCERRDGKDISEGKDYRIPLAGDRMRSPVAFRQPAKAAQLGPAIYFFADVSRTADVNFTLPVYDLIQLTLGRAECFRQYVVPARLLVDEYERMGEICAVGFRIAVFLDARHCTSSR